MAFISERELRDDLDALLQRAESGKRIVIVACGREVAELGPVRRRRFVPAGTARAVLAGLPPTQDLMRDVGDASSGGADPWAGGSPGRAW